MNNQPKYESEEINLERISNLIQKAEISESVDKWDIGASSSSDQTVQVDNGKPKQLKATQRCAITIRVWNKRGLIGITSSSDLTLEGINKAFASALKASDYGNPKEIPQFSPLANKELTQLKRPSKSSQSINQLLERLKDAESRLLNKHEAINSVPYNGLSEAIYEKVYINSNGSHRHIKGSQASLYLYARGNLKNRNPRSAGSIKIGYGSKDIDFDGCINEAADKTINHLEYKPIKTGKYLICLAPEAFLDLIGAFSNIFNARSIIDEISLSKRDSLGTKVAVPFLSIFDDPLNKDNISAINFDGEGTPTRKLSLIKNGILDNFIHSEATARLFGVKPTGHAGLGAKASVGPDWLVVSNSDTTSPNRMNLNHANSSEQFILVESLSALHAGIKASQGSFSLPFDGFLVENGKKISIEAATLAGDIRDLLLNIIDIEDKQHTTHQGISPYIWIQGIKVTGEA